MVEKIEIEYKGLSGLIVNVNSIQKLAIELLAKHFAEKDVLTEKEFRSLCNKAISDFFDIQEYVKNMKYNINPAHICMNGRCKEYLGHRGFCSEKCHDEYYKTVGAGK